MSEATTRDVTAPTEPVSDATAAAPDRPQAYDNLTDSPTHHHEHSDRVTLPLLGTMKITGGIYTVVFIGLGILTLLEVLMAETMSTGTFKIVGLMLIAIVKSFLVIWYYMHLNRDGRANPVYYVVLLLPLVVTLLSIFFLLGAPITGGLGYQPA